MKYILIVAICLLANSSLAAPPDVPSLPWNVVGKWRCTHPAWTDTITIRKNGTFSRSGHGDGGQWTLAGLHGNVILVLAWKNWGAETVTMIDPGDFRGKVNSGELVMHRADANAGDPE